MNEVKIFIFTVVLLFCNVRSFANNIISTKSDYLKKPTGQYSIGFEDFHWINKNICPDFNFNGKNQEDFSPGNKKHCHEIMIRIYYPTAIQAQENTPYYPPFIKSAKNDLKKIPGISSEKIQQLDKVKSFSIKKAPIVLGKKFPILTFSPGFGVQSQLYENIITDLVSHGYIVVGINTVFINGEIQLPNGHIVKSAIPKNREEVTKKFLPLQMQDLSYTFKQLHTLHRSNPVFSAMDLKNVGALGHSIGARTVARIIHVHPDWFKAGAALDIAFYEDNPITIFPIPFMHMISAYWKFYFSWPLVFELGKNGYLVIISPYVKNKHYSYHMNYSDFSTLQYLPVYKDYFSFEKINQRKKIDLRLISEKPTAKQYRNFNNPTYVLIKNQNMWILSYYESGKKVGDIGIDSVAGLESALSHLPEKPPEQLTNLEINKIKKFITVYQLGFGNSLGIGNGWKITNTVTTYLIQFFDTFIKNEKNIFFNTCTNLTKDSLIKCGPGKA